MQKPGASTGEHIRALAESSLLIAVAFVLSYITLWKMPQGGSVTPMSTLPLLLIGQRRGWRWAVPSALIYGVLQIIQQFYPPPVTTALNYFLVVALDYVIAFGVFGLAFLFRKHHYGLMMAAPVCFLVRFICHFISGIIIWHPYALFEPIWAYSAWYNGSFLGIELIFVLITSYFLCRYGLVKRLLR